MPKNTKTATSLKKACQILLPLGDRPLLWLLPFYLIGIYLAWQLDSPSPVPALLGSFFLATIFFLTSFKRFVSLEKRRIIILAPACVALGFGLTARLIIPPTSPDHVMHYSHEEGSPQPLILGGTLLESSGRPGSNWRLVIDAREILHPGNDGPLTHKAIWGLVRVSVPKRPDLQVGDYLRLPLELRKIAGFKNPGNANYERYWGARGIWVSSFVKSPLLITSWPKKEGEVLENWREEALAFVENNTEPPASGILAAQLLGRRSLIDPISEEVFRALGLSHLLAVSGLHLGVWYGLCFWVLRQILRHLKPQVRHLKVNVIAAATALIPALFYAALVGTASPVLRAALMISAVTIALLATRRVDSWNVLAAAAWVILLIEPFRLFTASFQLSFVATSAMIAVFSQRAEPQAAESLLPKTPGGNGVVGFGLKWWRALGNFSLGSFSTKKKITSEHEKNTPNLRPKRSFWASAALASLAGTFGTAPLVAYHFSWLPWAGLIANVVLTPLFSLLILTPGLISLAIWPLSPALGAWLLESVGYFLNELMPVLEKIAQVSGRGLLLPAPTLWLFVGWYLAGFIFWRAPWLWTQRATVSGLILALAFLPNILSSPGDKGILRFTVLDVGQGSAIHLNMPDGQQMLIDGGGSLFFDPGESLITPYLLHQGISSLDVVALTHPDLDHLKGLVTIADHFKPKELWSAPWPPDSSSLYEEFLAKTEKSKRLSEENFNRPRDFGGAKVTILWPNWADFQGAQISDSHWVNNHGLVLKVEYLGVSFLVTGDLEKEMELELARRLGSQLASTVLIAPHHGAKGSGQPEFLKAVSPKWIVFSCGRYNYYGVPTAGALGRAEGTGAALWRTDLSGAAVFEVSNATEGVKVRPRHHKVNSVLSN